MNRMRPGDRLRLYGGRGHAPRWLGGRDCYFATFLGFIDNRIESREGDRRRSALVELDEEVKIDGLTGKYAVLTLRYSGQLWERQGIGIHINLVGRRIADASEMKPNEAGWVESHASYEVVNS